LDALVNWVVKAEIDPIKEVVSELCQTVLKFSATLIMVTGDLGMSDVANSMRRRF